MIYTPWPHQGEAIGRAVEFFKDPRPGNEIQIHPTGSGKSVCIANMIKELGGEPVLILQPSKEILTQNIEKYRSYGYDASMYSASKGEKIISNSTFATIGSIVKKPEEFKKFRHILIDECFPYDQYISVEGGRMKIGALVRNLNTGKPVPKVYSYDEKTGNMEYASVLAGRCIGEKPIFKLSLSGNIQIKATKEHPFLTTKGWKTLSDLAIGDCILTSAVSQTAAPIPNDDQRQLLLGSLLGDGGKFLPCVRNINGLRIEHTEATKPYLLWKAKLIGHTSTPKKRMYGEGKNATYSINSRKFFFLDEEFTKEYAIEHLTARSLAISWQDDGYINRSQNIGSLIPTAMSMDLTTKFVAKLLSMGIQARVQTQLNKVNGKNYYRIILAKEGVKKLSEVVAPYVHPNFAYKIHKDCAHQVGQYTWDDTISSRGACVVKSIEPSGEAPVYNIHVDKTETYVLAHGQVKKTSLEHGVIVHNCHMVEPKGGQYAQFISDVSPFKIMGLTATPYRMATNSFGTSLRFITRTRPRIFTGVNYVIQNKTLFDAGYLSPLEYFDMRPYLEFDRRKIKSNSTGTDFDEADMKAYMDAVHFMPFLHKTLTRLMEVRKSICVFMQFTDQCYEIAEVYGDQATVITAKTPGKERDEKFRAWRAGEIKMLLNVGIAYMGVDYPGLDTVVLGSPGKSLSRFYQKVGRAMRRFEGKKSGYLVDLCDNLSYFGKIEDLHVGHDAKGLWEVTTIDEKSKTGRRPLTNCILT